MGSSGSVQALTSTVLEPRSSITSTVVPLASGSGDQAMNASVPPRILTRTSPGPAAPRVATVITPTQPMAGTSATMSCRSSYRSNLVTAATNCQRSAARPADTHAPGVGTAIQPADRP